MILVLFTLGLIVGSFLNVLVIRHGTGKGLGGRSGCMSCGYQLRWYDLVPVLSWLYLGGRCRSCGTRISIQYPLVEMFTGVSYALLGMAVFTYGMAYLSVACVAIALMVAILTYDLHHTVIPDTWVYGFMACAALLPGIAPGFPLSIVLGGLSTAAPLFLLWAVSRGRWMGFGDVKLCIGIGFLLGPIDGLYAVMLAFMIGGIVAVPLLVLSSSVGQRLIHTLVSSRRRFAYTMKSEIPFGPFLIIATCIIWWLQLNHIGMPLF
jgi:leader peptidase (prepilin peptidase)/N-methyltransferase